ncbi:MAG: 4-hydroxythreonine-4-phosphate dehydrogenase PdxA, partial [Ignavibacteria bacterium]
SDAYFANKSYKKFDMTIAMYHDQGLIPFKMISFGRGVNFTAGLNIIRTSPDHGTAFDIAGAGKANPESTMTAMKLADKLARL